MRQLIFRQYTSQGHCIIAAGVEEIDVETDEQRDQVVAQLARDGWVLESIWDHATGSFV